MSTNLKSEGFLRHPLILAILTAVLLAIGARLNLRFGVIPFTLQSFVLFMAALVFPMRSIIIGVMLYLLAGWFLPVFSDGSFGLEFYGGRRTGYVLGFLPAAYMVVVGRDKFKDWFGFASLLVMGHAVILLCGWLWMVLYVKMQPGPSFISGVVTLMPGALLKSAIAAGIFMGLEYLKKKKAEKLDINQE